MSLRPRKEQVVFGASLVVLGLLVKGDLDRGAPAPRGAPPRGGQEYRPGALPRIDLALPDPTRELDFRRDLFTPPRDTAPLSPLELELPPIEPLAALRPPAAWGPGAQYMSAHLRQQIVPSFVAGLFDPLEEEPVEVEIGGTEDVRDADLTPEERAERTAGYKRLYDWILLGNPKFGHIRNSERYGLARRPSEAILFVEVNPRTGLEVFPGQQPIPYERDRVEDFGFADNPTNQVELGRREFGERLRPADFEQAMLFADECVRLRNEAPRALEIAEEIYTLGLQLNPDEARPRLGLARCYESGFRFEQAFDTYQALLADGFHINPSVQSRLGELYARFRMPRKAEASYREALRVGRTSWEARWRYGRFLLGEGRGEEALDNLAEAERREPTSPEMRPTRVAIRADHGWALLHVGRMQDALAAFQRARNADPADQRGLAGVYSASLFIDGETADLDALGEGEADASFELLLAYGLQGIHQEQWSEARRYLELAVDADPFRAYLALRALSWLAERTAYPEEAYTFVQRAYENDPTDPWTLYQRGRLLAAQDDVPGALVSFQAALDQELDFADALIAMGELEHLRGRHEEAERYYERALSIDERRPVVHSLRGFNQLELGETDGAEKSFRAALRIAPELASARSGLAWWYYASGDAQEAITQFAELVESRRNEPETDLHKLFAEGQIERVRDHVGKEVWTDRFERRPGRRIGNEWIVEEPVGQEVSLRDGAVVIEGQFTAQGATRVYKQLSAERLLRFEAVLTIEPGVTGADVGIFVSRERDVRREVTVQAEVRLYRDKEGKVRGSYRKAGATEAEDQDLFTSPWVPGESMKVAIERIGKGSDATLALYVDGERVLEGLRAGALGRSTQALRFGVFVEAATGRSATVHVDDVRVIRRVQ